VRIRSLSNWEERGTQEGAGEGERVTLRGNNVIQRGKRKFDGGVARVPGVRQKT